MFLVPMTRSASDLVRDFDRLFDESFDRFFVSVPNGAALKRSPALDVAESEQAYTVTLDLPGVAKDDVKVSIEGRKVSIEAKSAKVNERKDSDRVLVRERAESSFARSFVLPVELDEATSQAKYEGGVLELTLAKKPQLAARKLTIQ